MINVIDFYDAQARMLGYENFAALEKANNADFEKEHDRVKALCKCPGINWDTDFCHECMGKHFDMGTT